MTRKTIHTSYWYRVLIAYPQRKHHAEELLHLHPWPPSLPLSPKATTLEQTISQIILGSKLTHPTNKLGEKL